MVVSPTWLIRVVFLFEEDMVCRRRTLRRMLSQAQHWGLMGVAPKIKLLKQVRRSLHRRRTRGTIAEGSLATAG